MFPLVMGVLNVTSDSFSDGGLYLDFEAAVRRGREMVAEGADVVDIGGESTRPGAGAVPAEVELRRVVPVVEALAADVRVSIDTTKAVVAHAALSAGATILNDISSSLAALAAEHGAAFVAMHRKGTPADMQRDPRYDDVVHEVREFLGQRAAEASGAGVTEVYIDPGIGFGKTIRHNLELLAALPELVATGVPVLVGTSRKGFIGHLGAGGSPHGRVGDITPLGADDRMEGSLASAVWAMACGVAIVRVHDVAATVQAARLIRETAA
ncbi:MAG: dihydropteroate synthase [Acidimicrobiales bacterium]